MNAIFCTNYCCVWLVGQQLLEFPQDLRFIVLKNLMKHCLSGTSNPYWAQVSLCRPSHWLFLSVAWCGSYLFLRFCGHFQGDFCIVLHLAC